MPSCFRGRPLVLWYPSADTTSRRLHGLKKLDAFAAFAVISSVTCTAPLRPRDSLRPPPVQTRAEDEEDNFHGRVPLIPDTDPVFAGRIQGIKYMAEAIRRGYAPEAPDQGLRAPLSAALPLRPPLRDPARRPGCGARPPRGRPPLDLPRPDEHPGAHHGPREASLRSQHPLRGRRRRRGVEDHGRGHHLDAPHATSSRPSPSAASP